MNVKLDGISIATRVVRRSGRPYHHPTSQNGVGGQKGSEFVREIAIRRMPTGKRKLTLRRRRILMTKIKHHENMDVEKMRGESYPCTGPNDKIDDEDR